MASFLEAGPLCGARAEPTCALKVWDALWLLRLPPAAHPAVLHILLKHSVEDAQAPQLGLQLVLDLRAGVESCCMARTAMEPVRRVNRASIIIEGVPQGGAARLTQPSLALCAAHSSIHQTSKRALRQLDRDAAQPSLPAPTRHPLHGMALRACAAIYQSTLLQRLVGLWISILDFPCRKPLGSATHPE